MVAGQHDTSERTGEVVRLFPRGPVPRRPDLAQGQAPVGDLAPYERGSAPDDYRHRMIVNGLALLVCVVLVAAGIWLANTIAEMRKNQDCALSGRKNCQQIDVPTRSRW